MVLVLSIVANHLHIQISSKFIRAWVCSPFICSSDFRIKLSKITGHKDVEHTDYRQIFTAFNKEVSPNDACDPLFELEELRKIPDI